MDRETKQELIAEMLVEGIAMNAMHKGMAKLEVTKGTAQEIAAKVKARIAKPKDPARKLRIRNRYTNKVTMVDPTEKSGNVNKKAAAKAAIAGAKTAGKSFNTLMGVGTGGIDSTAKMAAAGVTGLVKGVSEFKKQKEKLTKQDRYLRAIEKTRERRRNPEWQDKKTGIPNYQSTVGPAPEQALPAQRKRTRVPMSSLTKKPPVPQKVD